MNVLVCHVAYHPFYRAEASLYPGPYIKEELSSTNFVNLNGFYFAYFNAEGITFHENKEKVSVDYLLFVANHPNKGDVLVGWFKHATVFTTCQQHKKGIYYYAIGKDEDCVLLEEHHRDFPLSCPAPYQWISMSRKLKLYLEKSVYRVNYRQSDVNKALNINFQDLKQSCEMIERTIVHQDYLKALQLTNRAIMLFGTKASLIYYKAWVLYLLLQYNHAVTLLCQIAHIKEYEDYVNYMLGNIFFETEDYDRSIQFLNKVKKTNGDEANYMLAQAYAMKGQVAHAKGAIEKALLIKPNEPVYQSFKQSLKEWNNE